VGRDISAGKETRYGVERSGVEHRWGRDIPHSLGPTHPTTKWLPGLSRWKSDRGLVLTTHLQLETISKIK